MSSARIVKRNAGIRYLRSSLMDGLLRHYSMEESSGDFVDAVSSVDLVRTGTVGQAAGPGEVGDAAVFGGDGSDDYASCSDSGIPTGSNSRAIGFWCRPAESLGTDVFVCYGTADNDEAVYLYRTAGGRISADRFGESRPITQEVVPTDVWCHVVLSIEEVDSDNSMWTLYLDGVVSDCAVMSTNTVLGGNLFVGKSLTGDAGCAARIKYLDLWDRGIDYEEAYLLAFGGGSGQVLTFPYSIRSNFAVPSDVFKPIPAEQWAAVAGADAVTVTLPSGRYLASTIWNLSTVWFGTLKIVSGGKTLNFEGVEFVRSVAAMAATNDRTIMLHRNTENASLSTPPEAARYAYRAEGQIVGGVTTYLDVTEIPGFVVTPGWVVFVIGGSNTGDPVEPAVSFRMVVDHTETVSDKLRIHFTEAFPLDVPVYADEATFRAAVNPDPFYQDKIGVWGEDNSNGNYFKSMFSDSDDRVGYVHGVVFMEDGLDVNGVEINGLQFSSDATLDTADDRPSGGGAIWVESASNVTIDGCTWNDYPNHPVNTRFAFDVLIQNCSTSGFFCASYDNVTTTFAVLLVAGAGLNYTVRNCTVRGRNILLYQHEQSPGNVLLEGIDYDVSYDDLSQDSTPFLISAYSPGNGTFRFKDSIVRSPCYFDRLDTVPITLENIEFSSGFMEGYYFVTNIHPVETGSYLRVGPDEWTGPEVYREATISIPAGTQYVRPPIGLRWQVDLQVLSGTFTGIGDVHGNSFLPASAGGAVVDMDDRVDNGFSTPGAWWSKWHNLPSDFYDPPLTGYEHYLETTVFRFDSVAGGSVKFRGYFILDSSNDSGENLWALL